MTGRQIDLLIYLFFPDHCSMKGRGKKLGPEGL